IPSTIASSKLVVCFGVEVFFGLLALTFFFSLFAMAFASRKARSFSVMTFFTPPVFFFPAAEDLLSEVFFEVTDFDMAFLVAFAFLSGFFAMQDLNCFFN